MDDRWVIVGLGNPGQPYSHNRHNVGFWTINRLARLHGIELKTRSLAATGEGRLDCQRVILAKPRTFVNRSGQAVDALLKHAGLGSDRLLVVCDDLDLPTGKLRLRSSGGHGGHNGLRSIVRSIGSNGFPRIRIGIGRPLANGEPSWDPDIVAVWVLSDPPPEEAEKLQVAVAEAAEAVEVAVKEGFEAAMNRFNR